MKQVNGFCPMGCGETLWLDTHGYVTCQNVECERPRAASELLALPADHFVTFDDFGFTVEHPMRERVLGTMPKCEVHAALRKLQGPPVPNGRYKVTKREHDATSESFRSGDIGYDFEPVGEAAQ
jgi:hypothetical protein